MKRQFVLSALSCAIVISGQVFGQGPAIAADAKKADAKKKSSDSRQLTDAEQAAVSSGALTPQEARTDCKRMAGQMQIRILEHRGGGAKTQGSGIAQGLQSTVVPIFGGTKRGADAEGDGNRDMAKLKAMNQILIARNCAHYDLDAELKMDKSARTPRLIKSKSQAAKKKP